MSWFEFCVDFATKYDLLGDINVNRLLWWVFMKSEKGPVVIKILKNMVNVTDFLEPRPFMTPDPQSLAGDIPLGVAENGGNWGVSLSDLNQNLMVIGRPGSGKTTFLINLIMEIDKRDISDI